MKEILKLSGYLFVVCAVAGVALSGTNRFTFEKIKAGKEAARKKALSEVLPGAVNFRQEKDYHIGFDRENSVIGYVLGVTAIGYSGNIEAIVGVDKQLRVAGLKVLSQTETPGLGAKITQDVFLKQFRGCTIESLALKKEGGRIDAITAATISSRAITNAVKGKIDEFQKTYR